MVFRLKNLNRYIKTGWKSAGFFCLTANLAIDEPSTSERGRKRKGWQYLKLTIVSILVGELAAVDMAKPLQIRALVRTTVLPLTIRFNFVWPRLLR